MCYSFLIYQINGLFAWEVSLVWYVGWRNSVLINFPGRWGMERVMRDNKGGSNTQKPLVPLRLRPAATSLKSVQAETPQVLRCWGTCGINTLLSPLASLCSRSHLWLSFSFIHLSANLTHLSVVCCSHSKLNGLQLVYWIVKLECIAIFKSLNAAMAMLGLFLWVVVFKSLNLNPTLHWPYKSASGMSLKTKKWVSIFALLLLVSALLGFLNGFLVRCPKHFQVLLYDMKYISVGKHSVTANAKGRGNMQQRATLGRCGEDLFWGNQDNANIWVSLQKYIIPATLLLISFVPLGYNYNQTF